jgi:hypothetical protein
MRWMAALALVVLGAGCLEIQVGEQGGPSSSGSPADGAPAALRVSFATDPAVPRAGQTAAFRLDVKGLAAGDRLSSVAWAFGDGTASSQRDPIHAFASAGDHPVSVQVRSAGGASGSARQEVVVLAADGTVPKSSAPALATVLPPTLRAHVERNVATFTYEAPYEADLAGWDFGDGTTSSSVAPSVEHTYLAKGWFTVTLRLMVGGAVAENSTAVEVTELPFQPHVVVGVADSGFNVYHQVTEAEDPTVGPDLCILDDTERHGTGTSSSVLSENPDAFLVLAEGKTTAREHFATGELPVDVISHSWGSPVPTPLPCSGTYSCTPQLFEVTASGNEGAFPVVLDGAKSHPSYMTIGAADAGSRSEPGYWGFKTMDYVSEGCRPTADTRTFDGTREQACGTSFSAPTFAGALSRVVLELRRSSGYDGTIHGGLVDPILGVSMAQVRDAINHTATYEPEDQWGDGDDSVPLVAPWYQWGWGYYDRTQVDETMACLLEAVCPARPPETVAYMEALWTYRNAYHTV